MYTAKGGGAMAGRGIMSVTLIDESGRPKTLETPMVKRVDSKDGIMTNLWRKVSTEVTPDEMVRSLIRMPTIIARKIVAFSVYEGTRSIKDIYGNHNHICFFRTRGDVSELLTVGCKTVNEMMAVGQNHSELPLISYKLNNEFVVPNL